MRSLNIVPLLTDAIDPLSEQLIRFYRNGAISETAFIFSLVPEGDPVFDKAAILAERFLRFRERLSGCGMPVGILLQSTLGHGWVLDTPAPFPRLVRPDGSAPGIYCPLGEEVGDYLEDAVRRLAALRPAFFMVDDDFRLTNGRGGCFCPLHLAEFNRRTGRDFDREALRRAIAENAEMRTAYEQLIDDSLAALARRIRKAIDGTDSAMPCSYCSSYAEIRHTPQTTRLFAAAGQKPMVRINSDLYLKDSPRSIPDWLSSVAAQIACLPRDFEILAEPDTFPHNRYSTSAAMTDVNLTWTLLEGCKGGKLWMTRTRTFEPESGEAYGRILEKNMPRYRVLAGLDPVWEGAAVPLPPRPRSPFLPAVPGESPDWGSAVLGKFGIPYHFCRDSGRLLLSGKSVAQFSDGELAELLKKPALLDGSAAVALAERGFAARIGCESAVLLGRKVSFEQTDRGEKIPAANLARYAELRPREGAIAESTLFRLDNPLTGQPEAIAPGCLRFGDTIILAAYLEPFGISAFSYLNQSRKRQLIRLLQPAFYYPGDAEVMLRLGRLGEDWLLAAINLGLDPLKELEFGGIPEGITRVQQLDHDGEWKSVPFDGKRINLPWLPLETRILRFKK